MQLNDYQQQAKQTALYNRDTIADFLKACVVRTLPNADIITLDIPRDEYLDMIEALEKFGLYYTTMGLAGEAGEVANKAKKVHRDDGGKLFDERRKQMKKELGGVMWYLATCADELGLTLDEVAQANLDTLSGRKERGTLRGDGDNR